MTVGFSYDKNIEKWGIFELKCSGPSDKNPFVDYWIQGTFYGQNECITTNGFYDGNGTYVVRFMPSFEGLYRFKLKSNFPLENDEGSFSVHVPSKNNHGPVRVHNTWHFAYEDGTPYYSIGTTCYVWELQSDELIEKTLASLSESAFNKIRFCIFPKHYDYNLKEPRSYPYMGKPMDSSILTKENFRKYDGHSEGNQWNYKKFNTEHFRHIENCILKLQQLGIEADLIIMHPYDRWGFSCMDEESDELYLKYITARFSAYRNIWWSLANEYDLMKDKGIKDWERYADLICRHDPYNHLRSIHNCGHFYDYSRPWVTHCSIQRQDLYKTSELVNEWRSQYRKPVVLDEIAYEGNIQFGWGNITAQEMVRRFWEAACRGGYAGHGETYLNDEEILWWSHGGILAGESHKRLKLLLDILKETPGIGLRPYEKSSWDEVCAVPEEISKRGSYYLYYYSFMRPAFRDFYFDDTTEFEVCVIDTWDMKIERLGRRKGNFRIYLPQKQYMAIQIKAVS